MAHRSSRHRIGPIAALAPEAGTTIGRGARMSILARRINASIDRPDIRPHPIRCEDFRDQSLDIREESIYGLLGVELRRSGRRVSDRASRVVATCCSVRFTGRPRRVPGTDGPGADGVTVFPAVAPVRRILRNRIEWPSHHLDVYQLHDTPEYSVSGRDACGGSSRVSNASAGPAVLPQFGYRYGGA
jgi:hypothetical protein